MSIPLCFCLTCWGRGQNGRRLGGGWCVYGHIQSILILNTNIRATSYNSLGPNLWISHDWATAQPCPPQTMPQTKKPDVEGLGWCGYMWSVVVRPVGHIAKFSTTTMPIARSLKTWDICGIVLCDKTAHFRVAFYCPQHKVHLCNNHCVMIMLFNQHLHMPHLSGGWVILTKHKMLTNRDLKFVHNIWEK